MLTTDRFPMQDGPELWTEGAGETDSLTGWACTYRDTPNYSGRIVVPGAFTESLAMSPSKRKPLAMGYEHSTFGGTNPCGRWHAFEDREKGLLLQDGRISDTTLGRDVRVLVDDGVLTGLSVGFIPQDIELGLPGRKYDFGRHSYQVDSQPCLFITRGRLMETSLVTAPADDEARLLHLQSVTAKAARAMPGLRDEASWEDVAYSMALLMGGRGAGHDFRDMGELERASFYQRLAARYDELERKPPEYDPEPDYRMVVFEHDERDVFAQRYVAKTMQTLIAGLRGFDGALPAEAAELARTLNDRLPHQSDSDVGSIAAELRQAIEITGGRNG